MNVRITDFDEMDLLMIEKEIWKNLSLISWGRIFFLTYIFQSWNCFQENCRGVRKNFWQHSYRKTDKMDVTVNSQRLHSTLILSQGWLKVKGKESCPCA
jgi:hypothetical protein